MTWPEAIKDIIFYLAVAAILIGIFGEWPNFRGRK